MIKHTSCCKSKRIIVIRQLIGCNIIYGMELSSTLCELSYMKHWCARMVFIRTWPVQALFLNSLIAYAAIGWSNLGNLFHYGFRIFIGHGITHACCNLAGYFPVIFCFSGRSYCLSDSLDFSFSVAECTVFFRKASCRKNYISSLCSLC